MKKKIFCTMWAVVFILDFVVIDFAQMQSENYRVTTSVLSGGGAPMTSATYQTNATVSQSSPLMDPADPPYSTNYDLYPGFWYTLEGGVAGCDNLAFFAAAFGSVSTDSNYSSACDFDGDEDVDGSDLAEFVISF